MTLRIPRIATYNLGYIRCRVMWYERDRSKGIPVLCPACTLYSIVPYPSPSYHHRPPDHTQSRAHRLSIRRLSGEIRHDGLPGLHDSKLHACEQMAQPAAHSCHERGKRERNLQMKPCFRFWGRHMIGSCLGELASPASHTHTHHHFFYWCHRCAQV